MPPTSSSPPSVVVAPSPISTTVHRSAPSLVFHEPEPPPNVVNKFNPNEIVRDPGRRKQTNECALDIQDKVRMEYMLEGPMQQDLPSFPRTLFGSVKRAFSKSWYKNYTWLE
ncbi:hypothetical protein KIW84_013870 [Lathyrus oleraceus]|uniref:Uncharacterized protein n=1 Tax=Pisum sativum TaxID=3888 RepID=A0A9D5BLT6_PEA|nr:hypothetical protein KIW84_013870 [Pisum sativum]